MPYIFFTVAVTVHCIQEIPILPRDLIRHGDLPGEQGRHKCHPPFIAFQGLDLFLNFIGVSTLNDWGFCLSVLVIEKIAANSNETHDNNHKGQF